MYVLGLICLLLIGAVGNAQKVQKSQDLDCFNESIEKFEIDTLFPESQRISTDSDDKSVIKLADDFTLEYKTTYKVLTNIKENETYVLYQCGTLPPKTSEIPKGSKLFQIPLKGLAVKDSTVNEFLSLLEVDDRVVLPASTSVDPCMQYLQFTCNKTASDDAIANNDNIDSIWDFFANPDPKGIVFAATADLGLLNRAEWIKLAGAFFNREKAANQIFDSIKASVQTQTNQVKKLNADPVNLAWMSVTQYACGNAPADFYDTDAPYFLKFSTTQYKKDLSDFAGATIVGADAFKEAGVKSDAADGYKDKDMCIELPEQGTLTEDAKKVLKLVDVVIDESYYGGVAADAKGIKAQYEIDVKAGDKSPYKFVKNSKWFTQDGRVSGSFSLEWFEDGTVRVHQVLDDVVAAVHGEGAPNGADTKIIRNIIAGQKPVTVTQKECKAIDSCDQKPVNICPPLFVNCDGELVEKENDDDCYTLDCEEQEGAGTGAPKTQKTDTGSEKDKAEAGTGSEKDKAEAETGSEKDKAEAGTGSEKDEAEENGGETEDEQVQSRSVEGDVAEDTVAEDKESADKESEDEDKNGGVNVRVPGAVSAVFGAAAAACFARAMA